jgi:hypothetical protein
MSREWFISEALSSVRRLEELLDQLSDEEITSLINLEEEAARRKVFLDKLYREARQRARKQFIR